jgi:hypothetical protein
MVYHSMRCVGNRLVPVRGPFETSAHPLAIYPSRCPSRSLIPWKLLPHPLAIYPSAALEDADSLKESCSLRALCVSEEPPSAAVENADSLKELCVSKEPTPLTDTSKEIPRRIYS